LWPLVVCMILFHISRVNDRRQRKEIISRVKSNWPRSAQFQSPEDVERIPFHLNRPRSGQLAAVVAHPLCRSAKL
jgi:hypothetical protein